MVISSLFCYKSQNNLSDCFCSFKSNTSFTMSNQMKMNPEVFVRCRKAIQGLTVLLLLTVTI